MLRNLHTTILLVVPAVFVSAMGWAAPPQAKSLGEQLYLQRCVACHGFKGEADGPALKDFKVTPKTFKGMPQMDVEKLLTGTGTSSAQHGSFKELTTQERQELINHVNTLINQ